MEHNRHNTPNRIKNWHDIQGIGIQGIGIQGIGIQGIGIQGIYTYQGLGYKGCTYKELVCSRRKRICQVKNHVSHRKRIKSGHDIPARH